MAQNKIKLRQITQDSAVTNGTIRFDGTNWAANNNLRTTSGGQLILPSYTSSSSFVGTAEGLLGFDENGNIITVVTGDTFLDDVFRIQDGADATKQIAFEASSITSGTTRTFTAPNANGTLALGTGAATQFARWNTANTLEGISSDRITIDASNKLIVGSTSTQRALSKAPWNWTIPATIISANTSSAWDMQLGVGYNGIQLYQRQVNAVAGAGTLWNAYMTYESSTGVVRAPLVGDFPMDMRAYVTKGTSSPYDPYDNGSAVSPMRVTITAVDGTTKEVSTATEFRTRLSSDGSNTTGGGNLVMTLQPNLDVTLHGYPNSRDDSGTPTNFLSTDASGNLVSNPTSILAGGITTLNTLTASTQTFATGTSGSDFNISSSSSTHTFNIPDAASSARGLVSTSAQSFSGTKNFNALLTAVSGIDLGVDNTTRGTVRLHSTNTGSVTIQPSNSTTTDYTLTLPTTDGDSGQVLSTDGSGVLSWISPSSGTPAGSNTQIQYNNSGAFGASTNFEWVDASTRLEVGSPASPGSSRIVVKGAGTGATDFSFQAFNSSDVERLRLTNNGLFQGSGLARLAYDLTSFFDAYARIRQPFDTTFTDTSGTLDLFHQYSTFAPTSGTGVYNGLYIAQQINQTGGANGITRGLFIDPTLVAAADFRAIETTVGKVVFGGTNAIQIPIGTTGQRVNTQGNIRYNTTATQFEGYNGSSWVAFSGGGGISDADYGDVVVSSSGTVWTVESATTSLAGKVELATTNETTTGTDTVRAVTPRGLSQSVYGAKTCSILVSDPNGAAITTGDGKAYVRIPAYLEGMNLVDVDASLSTESSSGAVTVQIRRKRSGSSVDMLSTPITIDASETDSQTAATAWVINTSNDDVSETDQIYIDIDGAGTGAKGLCVTLTFVIP